MDTGTSQFIFTAIPEWVLYHPSLSDKAIRVYGVIGRYANSEGIAWPSQATIAERLSTSVDTVQRCMKELIRIGALEAGPWVKPGKGKVGNVYKLIYIEPKPQNCGVGFSEGEPKPQNCGVPKPQNCGFPYKDEREPIRTKANKKPPTPLLAIPEISLEDYSQPVIDAFNEYLKYRKQAKLKAYTPIGAKMQLKMLSKEPDPQECVEYTIRNNYQGLFPYEERNKGGKRPKDEGLAATYNRVMGEIG